MGVTDAPVLVRLGELEKRSQILEELMSVQTQRIHRLEEALGLENMKIPGVQAGYVEGDQGAYVKRPFPV